MRRARAIANRVAILAGAVLLGLGLGFGLGWTVLFSAVSIAAGIASECQMTGRGRDPRQVTVRQWFRLDKAERVLRAYRFRSADLALQANGDAEQAAGIREETPEYLRLNGIVNNLWPTVPWWCKSPALPHVAEDIARLWSRIRLTSCPDCGGHGGTPGMDPCASCLGDGRVPR